MFLLLEFGSVAYKGENGFVAPPPHLTTHVTGKTLNQQPSSQRLITFEILFCEMFCDILAITSGPVDGSRH